MDIKSIKDLTKLGNDIYKYVTGTVNAICPECNTELKISFPNDGTKVCDNCGKTIKVIQILEK